MTHPRQGNGKQSVRTGLVTRAALGWRPPSAPRRHPAPECPGPGSRRVRGPWGPDRAAEELASSPGAPAAAPLAWLRVSAQISPGSRSRGRPGTAPQNGLSQSVLSLPCLLLEVVCGCVCPTLLSCPQLKISEISLKEKSHWQMKETFSNFQRFSRNSLSLPNLCVIISAKDS